MVTPLDCTVCKSPFSDENTRIPRELGARSRIFELNTIHDAREALARLRELRRDFDACTKRGQSSYSERPSQHHPVSVAGKGEAMLAGLSNIQRMRMIRSEIAYLEDLMVRLAAREFELEETMHRSYLSGIGEWIERDLMQQPQM